MSATMTLAEVVRYALTFLAVYVQVFFLVTFFEKRGELKAASARDGKSLKSFPSVAVVVPCWNEEHTVRGTLESLLALDYPKEKLQIIAVDDGSTDGTWEAMQAFVGHDQVRVFRKENGGKHTAVNFGIQRTDAELIGCLDADSFVAPDALRHIISTFEEHPHAYAIAPSILIHRPGTLFQKIQKVEYEMGVYIKKMLSFLGAIHVTPGPFSIFRREVFDRLGGFRKAHNTEDMEIAFRMQEHRMAIVHCHTALVHTVAPDSFYKLYRQRLRWIYGFIQNTIDYRHLLFRKKYGNFSFFTLPSGVVSISAAIFIFGTLFYNVGAFAAEKAERWAIVPPSATGSGISFDLFFVNTTTIVFVTVALFLLLGFAMFTGTRIVKQKPSWHVISYVVVYSVVAPLWLLKALWNSVAARKPRWR